MNGPAEDSRFADFVTLLVALGMIAGLVATVADLEPYPRLAVLCTFAWFVLMLPIHELGHAIVARAFGARIERISLGYGKRLFDRRVAGVRLVVRAFPVQGFVRIDGTNLLSRGAIAAIYAAGVSAEALVAGALSLIAGPSALFRGDRSIEVVLAETAISVVVLSALSNLVPRSARTEPNGEGGETNDGLAILRALSGR